MNKNKATSILELLVMENLQNPDFLTAGLLYPNVTSSHAVPSLLKLLLGQLQTHALPLGIFGNLVVTF